MAAVFWQARAPSARSCHEAVLDASDLPPAAPVAPPPASLFDGLPDGVLRFDAHGRVVYLNAAFERAVALPRRAFLGRNLEEVPGFAPYAALWRAALRDVLDTEEESWFKFRFDHPFGARHFDVRLLLERSPAAPHVTALLRDVTFTRGVVRESRGADALAATLLSAVNVGIALLDRELRIRHWNGFLEQLTGIAESQVLGRRPDEAFDLSPLPDLPDACRRMKSGALRVTEQREYALPFGAQPWVRERRTPVYDARGDFDGVLVIVERIDAARFAEKSLSALQRALEQAGELVLEVGPDGTVLDANDSALGQLGLERSDLGTATLLAIDAELTAGELAALIERLRRGGSDRRETRYRNRVDGSELRVEVIAQRAEHGQRETVFLLARDISARKRAELALVDSAERFRSLFDESPVALLLLDAHLRVLQANRAAGQLLDRALIDLVGQEAAQLLLPEDVHGADRLRRDIAAETLDPAASDLRLVASDGRVRWVRLVVRGWRDGRRERQYLLVLEDYTERKQAALQLEAAVGQQRTLLETMAAAVAQVRDGIVLRANGEFARLFGFDEAALAGIEVACLAQPASGDDEGMRGRLPEVEHGRTASAETRLYRSDGRGLWCLVQVRAVGPAAADGAVEAIYTFHDVTPLRESRESLARSLLELNLVFDATEVALLHLTDGRVVRCNAQAAAMFGRAAGPLGRAFAALIDWSPDQPVPEWLGAQGTAVEAPATEVRMRGADGTVFWALVSMRSIDAARPASGQIVTVLNIDARKRSEVELQRMRNYLDLVLESLPVMVAVRDARDGRFVSINRAGEALTGRPRDAIVGRTWHQLYPAPLADELAALDARAAESGRMIDEPRVATRDVDGRPLTEHRRVLPVFESAGADVPGTPRYLMSIVEDLTETVRTEAALQDTEAHFRELAEHLDAFVFIADRNLTRLVYASPRCEALLGIGAAQITADPRLALERVQAQERPALARRLPLLLARLARLRRTELTVRIDHPTLGARTVTARFTPVQMPGGSLRIFGLAEDTTEREAERDQRLANALQHRDIQMHEVHQRIRKNLQGVAGLLQQQAFAAPELIDPLSEAATRIHAVAVLHGLQPNAGDGVPFAALVQGIFSSLAGVYNVLVQVEPPGPALAAWVIPESEAVPMALAVNELGGNAIKHRSKPDQRVVARFAPRGAGIELRIEQPGRLKEGFDLARVGGSASGLGLVKGLLPTRGARLRVDQLGPLVITRLALLPPSIRNPAAAAGG